MLDALQSPCCQLINAFKVFLACCTQFEQILHSRNVAAGMGELDPAVI
jgi:hypothetical protein